MRWINASRKLKLFAVAVPEMEFTNDRNQERWKDHRRTSVARMASWRRGVRRGSRFLFCIAFLMLGIAITVGAVLLIVVPLLVGVAILASLFQSPRPR